MTLLMRSKGLTTCILERTGIPTEASALITIITGLLVCGELVIAGLMYVSVAAPDRVPKLSQIPLWWRMVALLGWSVTAGGFIQLAGVIHAQR